MSQNTNSWKKYGGIDHYDNLSNINVNSLVANNISLRNPYQGIFTICGELIVSNNTYLESDLYVYGNAYIDQRGVFYDDVDVSGSVDISTNLSVHKNTYLYNPLYLVGSQGQNLDYTTGIGSTFFIGDVNGIGLNKYNPQAALDICGGNPEVLNVFSSSSYNRNILARNNTNYGITLSTDLNGSYMDFYHSDFAINSTLDTGRGGGRIQYDPSGVFIFDVSSNLRMLSNMSISNRNDLLTDHVNKETLVVYDNSNNVFRPDVYNKASIYNGTALSLISSDNSSNTFLQITTPGSLGWAYGGGMYPNDVSRNMGTMGWFDVCNNYIPLELFVSGNSLVKNRGTIGINTFAPETEKYILDVNGPIHLHHNEVHLIKNVLFQVNSISFWLENTNYGVAVGTSLNINTGGINTSYDYQVLYTTNGGHTWNISVLAGNDLFNNRVNFTASYYNPENVVIAGNNGYNFYSIDAGVTWNDAPFTSLPTSSPSIYVNTVANVTRVYLAYPYDGEVRGIFHFEDYVNPTIPPIIDVTYDIYGMHGYFNSNGTIGRLFVAGSSIGVFDAIRLNQISQYTDNNSYNKIYTYDGSFAVAISETSIVYTLNGGSNWQNSSILDDISYSSLNDICIWDISHAIVVGNNGVILYTTNSAKTWNLLNVERINAMGNGANVINTSKNLTAVRMTDSYSFSIACVSRNYVDSTNDLNNGTTGITDMFYLHLPVLFNRDIYPSILDICGNMMIHGDIHIDDEGQLKSNNANFYMIDKTVQSVYFARDASNIHIGNVIGMTTVQHKFNVLDDVSLNTELFVGGDVSFNSNLFVNKDVSFNSRLYVGQDVCMNTYAYGRNFLSEYYDSLTGNLNVGFNLPTIAGKRPVIDIGTSKRNVTNINIGTATSYTLFSGNVIMTNVKTISKTITLNDISDAILLNDASSSDFFSSSGSGIFVNDYNFNNDDTRRDLSANNSGSAFITVSDQDCKGWDFKVATSQNIVQLHVHDLSYAYQNPNQDYIYNTNLGGTDYGKNKGDIYGGGLLILQPNVQPSGETIYNYSIKVAPIDINNIMLRDSKYPDNNANTNQVITTNVAIIGNLAINRSSITSGSYYALDVSGITYISNDLYVIGDVSLNADVFIAGDLSLNHRLFVGRDVSLNANVFIAGDLSMNRNLFVGGNVLTVGDVSFNSRLYVGRDVSLNANVFVAGDISMNRNLFVGGNVLAVGDVSFNSRLYVGSDVSLNANVFIAGDLSLNHRLFVGGDVSLNADVFIAGDLSLNSNLFVGGDTSCNGNIFFGNQIIYDSSINPYYYNFPNSFPISLINRNTELYKDDVVIVDSDNTSKNIDFNDGIYTYHVFTETAGSGHITFKSNYCVDYLIIGGGGAGGMYNDTLAGGDGGAGGGGGGGGAGGIAVGYSYKVKPNIQYNVVVGAGGTAHNGSNGFEGPLYSGGGYSSFDGIDVSGGGNGGGLGNGSDTYGSSSGGGGGFSNNNDAGFLLDSGFKYSYKGGDGNNVGLVGGGGGGSGLDGFGYGDQNTDFTNSGGDGGDGTTDFSDWISAIYNNVDLNESSLSSWNGISDISNGYIAAGGGGGTYNRSDDDKYVGYNGYGGYGGGGNGGYLNINDEITPVTDGILNTGSGGGGAITTGGNGGSGGSGIVIIRYKNFSPYAGSGISLCNTETTNGDIVGGYMVVSSSTNNYLNIGIIQKYTIQDPMLQLNYNEGYSCLIVNKDISLNNKLYVADDVSLNANLYVDNNINFINQIKNVSTITEDIPYFPISLINDTYIPYTTNGGISVRSGKYNYIVFKDVREINNSYYIHLSKDFYVSLEYLIIAGGGAGENNNGNGGGAGAVISGILDEQDLDYSSTGSIYYITVGAGGTSSSSGGTSSSNGGTSSFNIINATGGIKGSGNGGDGGKGTTNYSEWINDIRSCMNYTWISATSNGNIAAGGGGGANSTTTYGGNGGAGGGGKGGNVNSNGFPGIENTGSGGGGGGNGSGQGANGGSGIVILRYLVSSEGIGISLANQDSSSMNGGYMVSGLSNSYLSFGLIQDSSYGSPMLELVNYPTGNRIVANTDIYSNNLTLSGSIHTKTLNIRDVSYNYTIGSSAIMDNYSNGLYINHYDWNTAVIQSVYQNSTYTNLCLNPYTTDKTHGSVGINKLNPIYSLDVKGFTQTQSIILQAIGGSPQSYGGPSDTSHCYIVFNACNHDRVAAQAYIYGADSGDFSTELRFATAAASGFSGDNNLPLDRMIIKTDGKVGIGMNNPSYKLDVYGTIRSIDAIIADGIIYAKNKTESTGTTDGALVVSGGVGIDKKLFVGGDTKISAATESTETTDGALVVTGGVGIAKKLFVGGDTKISATTESTGTTVGALVVSGGVGIANKLFVGGDTKISSTTESTETTDGALVVSGGVGIAKKLFVGGNIFIGAKEVIAGGGVAFGETYDKTNILGSATSEFLITTKGQITGGSFNASSDYRIKKNVEPLTYENVNNINPVKYININTNKQDYGIIAHELKEIFPSLVSGEKDGEELQSVNYIGLISILIKEIKELKKRVDEIESKI